MSIESQTKRMGVEILKTTTERIAKIMTENSPNLVRDIDLKTQEAQWKKKKNKKKKLSEFSKGQIQRNPIPRYIIIKLLKTQSKEKFLKSDRKTAYYL